MMKDVLRNFTEFTGQHLRQSLFFNKVTGLRPATLLTKRFWYRCFPVNFAKLLRTPFLTEHLWWLILEALRESILVSFELLKKRRLNHIKHYESIIPMEYSGGMFSISINLTTSFIL